MTRINVCCLILGSIMLFAGCPNQMNPPTDDEIEDAEKAEKDRLSQYFCHSHLEKDSCLKDRTRCLWNEDRDECEFKELGFQCKVAHSKASCEKLTGCTWGGDIDSNDRGGCMGTYTGLCSNALLKDACDDLGCHWENGKCESFGQLCSSLNKEKCAKASCYWDDNKCKSQYLSCGEYQGQDTCKKRANSCIWTSKGCGFLLQGCSNYSGSRTECARAPFLDSCMWDDKQKVGEQCVSGLTATCTDFKSEKACKNSVVFGVPSGCTWDENRDKCYNHFLSFCENFSDSEQVCESGHGSCIWDSGQPNGKQCVAWLGVTCDYKSQGACEKNRTCRWLGDVCASRFNFAYNGHLGCSRFGKSECATKGCIWDEKSTLAKKCLEPVTAVCADYSQDVCDSVARCKWNDERKCIGR